MRTIRTYFEKSVSERSAAVATKFRRNKDWITRTYLQTAAQVNAVAQAYGTRFGLIPRAETAALILGNGPVWIETYLALSGAGVAIVPLDPKLHEEEVAYILGDSQAVVVTTDLEHLDLMKAISPRLPSLRAIVLVNGGGKDYEPIGNVEILDYAKLIGADVATGEVSSFVESSWYAKNVATADDVASIIYTSGTTGRPKGAMLTHGNFVADAEGAIAAFDGQLFTNDVFGIILPLFHAFSFLANFVVPIVAGAGMYYVESLYTISKDIPEIAPSVILAVPLLAEKMFDKIDEKINSSRMAKFLFKIGLGFIVSRKIVKGLGGRLRFIVTGGAPCPKHVLEGYRRLGISLIEGYGLTECSPVVSISNPQHSRIGTIGQPLYNIEVRVKDPNEKGVGELQVKGPIVMKGYFHNNEATAEAFDDGWLCTGDLASQDADGHLTIRGRKKSLIVNREGKNIYPEEVENRIASDPFVADCVVIGYTTGGIPGEKVGCIVSPNIDVYKEETGLEEVKRADMVKAATSRIHKLCHSLADYKRVRKILVVEDPLERTSIQKVRRVTYQGKLNE